jgi:lipid-A-disaccharide synthase
VKQVQRYVDEIMVIFPFEKTWYEEREVDVSFVGHPMLDLMDIPAIRSRAAVLRDAITPEDRTLVGILPGSRRNEIRQLLPRLLETARRIRAARPDIVFAIGCPPRLTADQLTDYLRPYMDMDIKPLHGQTHELMAASDYLLACSGTAMLEAGLLGTPMLGTYRFGWVTYFLLRLFMFRDNDQLFTLPNIVLGKRVVREMLQFQSDPVTLALAALDDLHHRLPELREELGKIHGLLGGPGASGRAAERVLALAGE